MSQFVLILDDVLKAQNPGVRSNPYKYKIVSVLDHYDHKPDTYIYTNIKDIPDVFRQSSVHTIEPDRDENTGCLYLKIVVF